MSEPHKPQLREPLQVEWVDQDGRPMSDEAWHRWCVAAAVESIRLQMLADGKLAASQRLRIKSITRPEETSQ